MEKEPENPYEVSAVPTGRQLSWLPVFVVALGLIWNLFIMAGIALTN